MADTSAPPTAGALVHAIDGFRFRFGETPLSSVEFAAGAVLAYLATVHAIKWAMAHRGGVHPMGLVRAHNFLLFAMSGVMAVLLTAVVLPPMLSRGLHFAMCSADMHDNGRLHALYFANYLIKMYEFVDTFILALRKREIIFLHIYHHAATFLLTYIQQVFFSTVQWVPILLNLYVHVVMYYYYYLQASGRNDIWWKRYVTIIQIVQFVLDLVACFYAYAAYLLGWYCHGTHAGAISGIAILLSYLVLFLGFYNTAYTSHKAAKSRGGMRKHE